ncbi:MAG: LPS assembly protein LptD [Pseudomonadota bacterium]
MRSIAIFVIILLVVVFGSHASFAGDLLSKKRLAVSDETPWRITAKSLTYNEKEGTYLAEGDVVITKSRQTLYTQRAIFSVKTEIAKVSGGLRLETDGDIVTGKEGAFNLNTQTGEIVDASLFLSANHYYIRGSHMEKVGEDTYVVKECTLTTCDGTNPDWTITGSEVNVTIEGYGTVKNSAFRVRGLPIIYVPYMVFPAKTKRQTGLLPPRVGYSTLNGGEAEIPFFWAISDQTDATLYARYMSRRGYMQGAEFRYMADENSKGVIEFDILSDKEKTKNMTDHDKLEISPFERTNSTRYWLRGRADQNLPLSVVARLDADYVSDQDYLREFDEKLFGFSARTDLADESRRPFDEKRSPTRRSALRLSRDGESYSLQGIGSYYQPVGDPSDNKKIEEPLGGLSFILLPEQLKKLPIFFNLESNYDYVWSDQAEKGHSLSISPQVNFPFWLGPYVEFEPSFTYTYNALWTDDNEGNKDHQYQSAYEAGARLATSAERVYNLEWFNAKKLRHKISPVLTYLYRGYRTNGDEFPWFSPIERGGYETPWFDSISQDESEGRSRNRVSLSLENFLDARFEDKKGRVSYQQWATFKLNQGYDIDKARSDTGKKPLTPLTAELTVTPFSFLDLRGSAGWDHYEHRLSHSILSGNLSLKRSGGRTDTYEVNYQYYQSAGETNINFRADVNLFHGFSVGGSLQRDIDAGQNISTAGWFGYQSQCWGLKLGAAREYSDTNIMVVIRLIGLGDAGRW